MIWIGTSGFQYPEWKGTFYPDKLALSKMLAFYAEHFSSTEINYTFRSIPSHKTLDNWRQATPANFKFSLKAPQKITHFAKLRNCAETLHYFYEVTSQLGDKLGVVLFQLPPTFKKDATILSAFLDELPSGMRAAFEFRHDSWFDDEVFESLKEHKVALCIAESAELATPRVVTTNFGYLRLRREDYTNADIAMWAEWIRKQESRWRDGYIYFKHEEKAVGPKFAQRLMKLLAPR